MLASPDIWQDYDCPLSGIDVDLHAADIVAIGDTFYCAGCWKNHTAGVDVNLQTYVRMADGELSYRGMPKDALEKAIWITDAAPMEMPCQKNG